MQKLTSAPLKSRGFALVVTLSLMILLTLIAVGLLSLSAVSLRSSSQGMAQAEAQANARLALMIAIGELQKEMGPDMRVSAESALFDSKEDTETIDDVKQSHWLASYNSWGDWLNAEYTPPGGTALKISDTYTPGREKMFRRWLLSMPFGDETKINALDDSDSKDWMDNSVELVGKGSLGDSAPVDQVTRAYLTKIGPTNKPTGKHAWWISPENHKARIDMAKKLRTLSTDAWQTAQGDTAEVGVGSLPGFDSLDNDATLVGRLITTQSLRPAQVAEEKVQKHFFDLAAHSQGVLASVRSGHLKKDLSLLLEKGGSQLPTPYKFNPGSDIREPSIRPMSPELKAKNPKIPNRHFASWTNMRHYYRMYRSGSDATPMDTGGSGSLNWQGSKPSTDFVSTSSIEVNNPSPWIGSNNYWRVPVLAKLTIIYSLLAEGPKADGKYSCSLVYTPVFTYWNPYNVELRIPNDTYRSLIAAYKILPFQGQTYLGNTIGPPISGSTTDSKANANPALRSSTGNQIVFKPGEFIVFSFEGSFTNSGTESIDDYLKPGFNPQAVAGFKRPIGDYIPAGQPGFQNPGFAIEFSHIDSGGNINWGNTPGSLCHSPTWTGAPGRSPLMYQNDWFQMAQTHTPITPTGTSGIARYSFDSKPKPFAYAQLVIKGLSTFNYESIKPGNPAPFNWAQDWRSRNWIQAPPFYFGNSLYISEDRTIAHTQRLDNPYVMNFGPMSMNEMPQVVPHLGQNSFLGSGSSPREQITSAAMLELPSAPVASLAGFSNMRIKPGWTKLDALNPDLKLDALRGTGSTGEASLYCAEVKAVAYQSGVTGPGIGNSFMHPMLPRNDVYKFFDNSKSQDPPNRVAWSVTNTTDNKVFNDYWDHVFLLNDALWDDYFVSSLADQRRGINLGASLNDNLDRLIAQDPTKPFSNNRYRYYSGGQSSPKIKSDLQATDGYLKAAKHLMVDGMFNVNSTSVAAWQALFAGIRERQLVFRASSGTLQKITVPSGKRIALSRFDTEVSDQEMDDPESGAKLPDGSNGWSGVRYLDDDQLQKLAVECVKQVKKRGPFLNFSEFINRRLSNDDLGLMGALQSAIDYDDKNLDSKSINYRFKDGPDYMLTKDKLGVASSDTDITKRFSTPEAAEGSRFAGIPGYVIQSDLLKPIANTLAVRDDTFRIRAYGESLANGKVVARAWCEAVVQRMPEYQDPADEASVPARLLDTSSDPNKNGTFSDNPALSPSNLRFGRKFRIESFRWLNAAEV